MSSVEHITETFHPRILKTKQFCFHPQSAYRRRATASERFPIDYNDAQFFDEQFSLHGSTWTEYCDPLDCGAVRNEEVACWPSSWVYDDKTVNGGSVLADLATWPVVENPSIGYFHMPCIDQAGCWIQGTVPSVRYISENLLNDKFDIVHSKQCSQRLLVFWMFLVTIMAS